MVGGWWGWGWGWGWQSGEAERRVARWRIEGRRDGSGWVVGGVCGGGGGCWWYDGKKGSRSRLKSRLRSRFEGKVASAVLGVVCARRNWAQRKCRRSRYRL